MSLNLNNNHSRLRNLMKRFFNKASKNIFGLFFVIVLFFIFIQVISVFALTTTLAFQDNFDSLNSASILGQNSWIGTGSSTNPGTWTVTDGGPSGSGKKLAQTATSPNILNSAIVNTTTGLLSDSEMIVDFKIGSTGSSNPVLWIRKAVTGTPSAGYTLAGPAYNLRIYKENEIGTFTQISTGSHSTTLTPGNWYTGVFRAVNTGSTVNLSVYIYPQGQTRPDTPIVTATDDSNTSPSGYAGLGASNGDIDFDNFIVNSISTQGVPEIPTGLIATALNLQVELSWTAPASNGSDITDYLVEYRTGSDSFVPFPHSASTASSIAITGLTNDLAYDFRVSAINGIGTSLSSGVVTATPTIINIPLSNLKLWLKADTGTYQTVDGDISTNNLAVGQWGDLSGNNNDLQQTTTSPSDFRPTLITDAINNNPVLRFNGVDNYLTSTTNSTWKFLHDTTGFSTFFVLKTTDAVPSSLMTLYDTGGISSAKIGSAMAINTNKGFYRVITKGSSPAPITGSTNNNVITTQTPNLVENTYLYNDTGNDYNLYVNGTNVSSLDSSSTLSNSNPTYNLGIGAMTNGTQLFFKGDIAEILIFDSKVSDTVRQQIECYLGTKYNITVSPNCSIRLPSSVSDLSGTFSQTEVDLSWTAPTSNGSDITDYVVQYRVLGSTNWTTFDDGNSSNTGATIINLTTGSTYEFRVSAVNGVGQGLTSNIIREIPHSIVPTVPTVSNISFSGTQNVNEKLTGLYTYSDINGDSEGISTFRWLLSNEQNGSYSPITGAMNITYTLTSSDLGKYIKFEVTPVSTVEPTIGNTMLSAESSPIGEARLVIHHILSTGQSLAIGSHGSPALTTTQPYNNLMLDEASFVPLIEGSSLTYAGGSSVETMSSSMANTITSLDSSHSYQSAVSMHGVGGTAYSGLKKGTSPYTTGMAQITNGKTAATSLGDSYKVSAVTVVHGETDHNLGTTEQQYEADLVQWQSDYENDAKAITGQDESVLLFTDQMDSFTDVTLFNSTTSRIPIAQLAAAEDNPTKIYLVGPKYFLPYLDGVHLTNVGYRWLGEYYGKVMKKVLVDGVQWKPLSPSQILRSGNVITVKFNVPVPPIQFDTTRVIAKTNYGFEYADDSSSASISSVSILDSDTVKIILNTIPTSINQRLRYAYTGVGGADQGAQSEGSAHGNLRDSDNTPSLYGSDLFNWGVHFDKAITEDSTPPSIPVATPSANTYNSTQSVALSATGSDYIKYSLIETPATCSAGTLYSDSTPISIATSQTIYVRACDNVDNSSTQSFAYVIDSEAPSTAIASPVAGTYTTTQLVTLTATGSDSIRYSTTETPATCSAGTLYTASISASTSQTIYVRACDTLNNFSTTNFVYIISPIVSHSSGGSSIYAMAQFKTAQQALTPIQTPTVPSIPSTPIIINRILKLTTPRIWGDDIKALQTFLNTKGYNSGTPDGNFGPKTQSAVIAFQKANGLVPDGSVGSNTLKYLNGDQTTTTTSSIQPTVTRILKLSVPRMIGDDVKTLQTYLSEKGYDAGTPDGILGNKTKSAIIAFQTANNLTPDGLVGAKTLEMMK